MYAQCAADGVGAEECTPRGTMSKSYCNKTTQSHSHPLTHPHCLSYVKRCSSQPLPMRTHPCTYAPPIPVPPPPTKKKTPLPTRSVLSCSCALTPQALYRLDRGIPPLELAFFQLRRGLFPRRAGTWLPLICLARLLADAAAARRTSSFTAPAVRMRSAPAFP